MASRASPPHRLRETAPSSNTDQCMYRLIKRFTIDMQRVRLASGRECAWRVAESARGEWQRVRVASSREYAWRVAASTCGE